MAQEVTINGTLVYEDANGVTRSIQITDLSADVATLKCNSTVQSVGTSEEAIALGEITAPGWFMAINHDPTNFVYIKTGTGGSRCGKMLPGESYGPVRLGPDMQVPFAIADTGACLVEFLLIST